MPRNVQRKSASIDVRKRAKKHSMHPYNLRKRNIRTNYNEKHLSRNGMTVSQRRPKTFLIRRNASSPRLNGLSAPTSINSLQERRESEEMPTNTLYVNENLSNSDETSSINSFQESRESQEMPTNTLYVNENLRNSDETSSIGEYGVYQNTAETEDNADRSDTELNDENYLQNYSASAYNYQELVRYSNLFHIAHAASEVDVRNAPEMDEHLEAVDVLASGDGVHNNRHVLEISVRILDSDDFV